MTKEEIQGLEERLVTLVTSQSNHIVALTENIRSLTSNIQTINTKLSYMDGVALPSRIKKAEDEIDEIKLKQSSVSYIPKQVDENSKDIRTLFKWLYIITGMATLLNFILTIFGKYLADFLIK